MAENTKRSVLLEWLKLNEEALRVSSKNFKSLEPEKGMEDKFDDYREKCDIIRGMIQALEYEPVKKALAEWQIRAMSAEHPDLEDLK